jgi:glycine cleavage system H protein
MLIVDGFNGYRLEIPEDRYYLPGIELWVHSKEENLFVFGLTQAGIILAGGVTSLEFLVEEGQSVSHGEPVAFAVTSKVKYIDTPLAGVISNLNRAVIDHPALFQEDPYGRAWIFSLRLSGPINIAGRFWNPISYHQGLLRSEACGNPQGLKGGVSPTCRTIYSGIQSQKKGDA